jgi:hypothetical protein|nr:MAG TPA: hypothetical protein [Caudoviricetes sp.]
MKVETQKAWKEREAGEMANMILNHMKDRNLTLEVLDETIVLVQDIFVSRAVLMKPELQNKAY